MLKTKREIIKETYDYYSTDPSRRGARKTDSGFESCSYFQNERQMCAVGRCFLPQYQNEEFSKSLEGDVEEVVEYFINKDYDFFDFESYREKVNMSEIYEEFDALLKPEYRGHEIQFWQDLQGLHDFGQNWSASGISEIGKKEYYFLLEKYQS